MLNVLKKTFGNKSFIALFPNLNRSVSTSQKVCISKSGGFATNLLKQQLTGTRTMSTLQNHNVPIAALSKDESHNFMAIFPDIVRDLSEVANNYSSSIASNWFTRALQYNVPKGKKNRGILAVLTYKNLVNPEHITEENIKLARILGWCVELLQCFLIINDDVMDNSSTRRGQPCWHKLENVGLTAINDALMIENAVYILLKKYFSHMDCYIDLLHLFHEVTFITTCGQSLDLLNATQNVTSFDMEKYKAIVTNKTSYYSFYLPFAVAMYLAGIKNHKAFQESKAVLLEMGHFFQVQDDFLDCFGSPDVTGKVGTDIQDNKCSWLSVVCMQLANEQQKQIMINCYGKNDPKKVAQVIELYKTLGLTDKYAIYEEESYNMIKTRIQKISHDVPQQIFLQILNRIYQRNS